MGKATANPLLFGAILLAALGALWLATIAVLPERATTDTDAAASAVTTDGGPAPASLEATAPESAVVEPEPTAAATRTKLAVLGQTLRAVVVDREGNPRAGLEVTLSSTLIRAARIVNTTATDGTLSFPDLPPASYYPSIADHEILEPTKHVVVEANQEPDVLRIVCVKTPVLAGRIVEHAGNPVPAAWAIVEDLSGAELNKIISGGDGTFRIKGNTRSIKHDGVRLWVHSGGKWAMPRKHETHWGDVAIELRVAPAPRGTLRVVAAGSGEPVRAMRLWVDLAPGARAQAPWVADGWIATQPDQDPEVAGLGLVPLRLIIYPIDMRFACHSLDVAGGTACHDVRVELGATATLAVRTEPPAARATVQILRLPTERSPSGQPPGWERGQHNPNARQHALVVGASRANELGQATLRGGNPGETVIVRVQGNGLAGQTDTTLALSGEVAVPMAATASLEVSLAEKPSDRSQLTVRRVTAEGGPDPLGLSFVLHFGGAPEAELLRLTQPAQTPNSNKIMLWQRALWARDSNAIKQLLEDATLDADVRRRLERWRDSDTQRARVSDMPPGRYWVAPYGAGEHPREILAEFDLRAGEHKDLTLDSTQRSKLELKVTLPPGPTTWGLVDEDTGAQYGPADARAWRARVLASAVDGRRWLSRDVFSIPSHGVVNWTPDLVPMRITLRLRSNGRPIGHTAVSRVAAHETTGGWHGRSLGLTDAAGEVELAGSLEPFKLRIDGVAALAGPYTPDARREVQVIDVEVP